MKKAIAGLVAVCLLCLTACSNQEDAGLMSLQTVSGLVSEKGYTEEYFEEKLSGQFWEDLIDLWGEPDKMLSGFWGDIWFLDDKTNQQIILYYDENGAVENVRLVERFNSGVADIHSFSYAETLQMREDNNPGVKADGFQNTAKSVVSTAQQVIDRAKNECTIEYDTTDVAYDSETDIWRVIFFTEGSVGNSQEVYLDGNGMTALIIYGE